VDNGIHTPPWPKEMREQPAPPIARIIPVFGGALGGQAPGYFI